MRISDWSSDVCSSDLLEICTVVFTVGSVDVAAFCDVGMAHVKLHIFLAEKHQLAFVFHHQGVDIDDQGRILAPNDFFLIPFYFQFGDVDSGDILRNGGAGGHHSYTDDHCFHGTNLLFDIVFTSLGLDTQIGRAHV